MSTLKIKTKKNPLKSILKNGMKPLFTKITVLAIVLIISGLFVMNLGYKSNSTYTANYLSYSYDGTMNQSQNLSSDIGIAYNTATLVQINSQLGNISWSIWCIGTYTNSTGCTITTHVEKYSNVTNSLTYSKYFPTDKLGDRVNGIYYINLKNIAVKSQNVTINVYIQSPSKHFTEPQFIFVGVTMGLIGILILIEEITRLNKLKSEGKHLLDD